MKLSTLTTQRKALSVPCDGGVLMVGYNPSAYTPRLEAQLRNGTEGPADLAALLVAVLKDWDLTDEEEQPVPITLDSLLGLPITLLAQIAEVVTGDLVPNSPKTTPSGFIS